MTTLNIQIRLDNAAFEDSPEEISKILKNISFDLSKGYSNSIIRDSNGNNVGEFAIVEG